MKNKKLMIGITAIIIITAIFIVSEMMTSIRPPEHRTKFFPELEERHISAIAVNERGVTRLEKIEGAWMVAKDSGDLLPANETLVQIAAERIASLKKGELVSDNPSNQVTFGVDTASGGAFVEIFTADKNSPAFTLRIGKSGPDRNSNYARLAGSDAVYLIPGNVRQALFFDIERWKKPAPPPEPEPFDEENADNGIDGE